MPRRSPKDDPRPHPALDRFDPATAEWFTGAFGAPTAAQEGAWEAIANEQDVLVVAPTGSGKTLAAFLSAIDGLAATPRPAEPQRRCRVLYISPLKALGVDVERNLAAPLEGIAEAARRLGRPEPEIRVGVRTGDTPPAQRRSLALRPPDILITTPESLFLMLTSKTRESLVGIETVIVDEVHAVAGTKRGAHLALSLERLDELLARPARRIGLSATVRPVEEVARFLAPQRNVAIVQPPSAKVFDLSVVVPVEDMGDLGGPPATGSASAAEARAAGSIWPHVEERITDLVEAHRSTIIFTNARRVAERLSNRLNEIEHERLTGERLPEDHRPAETMGSASATPGAPPVLARTHHGSLAKEQRAQVEDDLKSGRLRAVVATSSLELGIDMGAVDLVVQVEAPPSVASGLQRVGRAGHQVGAVSRGVFFPKTRGDLVQSAVVAERMRAGLIEALTVPANPLDVLAQQIVAICAMDEWQADDLLALVRRAAPFASLPTSAFEATLDMLAGRYPSDAFAELRPRLVWDRETGALTARPGAQRLAVTSGGTIPDRGLFGVFLAGTDPKRGGGRVGELDEEMVYESRVGDVFSLGTSSWRIEEVTRDRVVVSPAPGVPGRLPFWIGDGLGRPLELGRALGAFTRELSTRPETQARDRLKAAGLDDFAARNALAYLQEQKEATGHVPDDRTIVVERFRDELGDWRIVVHSPFGAQVHAPWALALGARLRERHGVDPQLMHHDDGIVLRLPDTDDFGFDPTDLAFDKDEITGLVTEAAGGSALFASRFREAAARALLLPHRQPGKRQPLWQQRLRSSQLLEVAGQFPSFPIILEAVREVLQDVYDVPGLAELMGDIASRTVRLVEVTTAEASPFARSLLFGYVAQFMYQGDSPLAERRAAALSLDSRLLGELLGQAELRELLDPNALAQLESELQWRTEDRRARDAESVADLLRLLGPLTDAELDERGADLAWAEQLMDARRAILVEIAGHKHWAAIEDAGRLRDALGTVPPPGVPEAFLEPGPDPLGDLLARYARTHGPFTSGEAAARFGLGTAVADGALHRLAADGRLAGGEFRPGGDGREWCDATVLRRLRRRSLSALRKELEPVAPAALAEFLPQWQHIGGELRGVDGLARAVEQLQGVAVPASALETLVLPSRVHEYAPPMLDELTASGEVVWAGRGALPGKDGWIALYPAEAAPLLLPEPEAADPGPLHRALLDALAGGYGLFFRQLVEHVRAEDPAAAESELAEALWDLVWSGRVTNDTVGPLRALLGSGRTPGATAHRSRRPAPRARYAPGVGVGWRDLRTGTGAMPATVAGRWSLLPAPEAGPTVRAHALASTLLDRHGVVTRGAVAAEEVEGGFAKMYRVLSAFEESGKARRGYVVEGLGAAQFAGNGAVDRLRAVAARNERAHGGNAVVLAAADPANAYGAALPWPEPAGGSGHKPGRKAGAIVVLVDGDLVLYLERGGKTLLAWPQADGEDWSGDTRLAAAVTALAEAARSGRTGPLAVERVNDASALSTPLGALLEAAGFRVTHKGYRFRS